MLFKKEDFVIQFSINVVYTAEPYFPTELWIISLPNENITSKIFGMISAFGSKNYVKNISGLFIYIPVSARTTYAIIFNSISVPKIFF